MSDDYKQGLHLVPEHMRSSVVQWIERGNPHPRGMGTFFHSLIMGAPWMQVVRNADDINRNALLQWSSFLHNYAPSGCYGSEANALAWWRRHHPDADPADATIGGET